MKIRILAVGQIKEEYFRSAIKEYLKRLSPYADVQIEEVNDLPAPQNASKKEEDEIKRKEGEMLLSKIKDSSYVIALDLKGEQMDSVELSHKLEKWFVKGSSSVTFIIGGSLGLGENILGRANEKWCLSKLTFTHQMTRVILLEQIYRAFKISRGEPYHK